MPDVTGTDQEGVGPDPLCPSCGDLIHEPTEECWWVDLADCPYFQGTGTCGYGCVDEPSCITDRPREGWPSERLAAEVRKALEAYRRNENHPLLDRLRMECQALDSTVDFLGRTWQVVDAQHDEGEHGDHWHLTLTPKETP